MEKLSNLILKCIKNNQKIPEELICEFWNKTIQIIKTECTEILGPEFWTLENYISLYWRFEKYNSPDNHDSKQKIYQMGQLISCINMINIINEKIKGH